MAGHRQAARVLVRQYKWGESFGWRRVWDKDDGAQNANTRAGRVAAGVVSRHNWWQRQAAEVTVSASPMSGLQAVRAVHFRGGGHEGRHANSNVERQGLRGLSGRWRGGRACGWAAELARKQVAGGLGMLCRQAGTSGVHMAE